jgi:hypothetical protein
MRIFKPRQLLKECIVGLIGYFWTIADVVQMVVMADLCAQRLDPLLDLLKSGLICRGRVLHCALTMVEEVILE